MYWRFKEQGTC